MKYLLYIMLLSSSLLSAQIIFQFNKEANINNWITVDDVVMGGRSSRNFKLNSNGKGVFFGSVSLENNGGFSSVRYNFEKLAVKQHTKIVLKLKGDGKDYQFRIKASSNDYYSYITSFSTTGEWQEIEIPLKIMYPSFRGRKVDKPNFDQDSFEEIRFLIANKKPENFELIIDSISLQ